MDNTLNTPILLSIRTITEYKQNKPEKIVDGGGGGEEKGWGGGDLVGYSKTKLASYSE